MTIKPKSVKNAGVNVKGVFSFDIIDSFNEVFNNENLKAKWKHYVNKNKLAKDIACEDIISSTQKIIGLLLVDINK